MKLLEYLLEKNQYTLNFDENGNVNVTFDNGKYIWESFGKEKFLNLMSEEESEENCFIISKDVYEWMQSVDIVLPENVDDLDVSCVRRPYYRMRGKPVTEEQAFEIIRKTDNFFSCSLRMGNVFKHPDYVGSINFDNWLINENHFTKGYGWVHTDGLIGTNAITQKYPEMEELIVEWFTNIHTFPYLDLIIAITSWDEMPSELWGNLDNEGWELEEEYERRFIEDIVLGVYVHDGKVEILGHDETVEKYRNYEELYGKQKERFIIDYYEDNNIKQVDEQYLRRCIEAYGLNADEELKTAEEYEWKASCNEKK